MTEVSQPLTPADCDLRDFQFMPLDVVRLRDSDIAVMVSGEEFRSAVMLWCAAWHQVPAGSLPNDDRSLASLAGYGRAVGEWQKVKTGALRGWLECSDGRLYHPVVCEKARESWESKLQHAYDKLSDRLRKLNKKREETGLPSVACPTFEDWKSSGRPLESQLIPVEKKVSSGGNETRSDGTEEFSGGNPPEKALKGEVREGTGKGDFKNPSTTTSSGASARDPSDPLSAVDVSMTIIGWERERGKIARGVSASNAQVMDLAAQKPTLGELRKAYDMAVADRQATGDANPVNAGFLMALLAKVRNPPRPREPKPLPLHAMSDTQLNAEGRRVGAGEARMGESRPEYIARIQTAMAAAQGRATA